MQPSAGLRGPAARELEGDLDGITLMALRRRPEERYSSAEQLAAKQEYDCIILDLMLPGEHGLNVARRLKNDGDIPVIIVSTVILYPQIRVSDHPKAYVYFAIAYAVVVFSILVQGTTIGRLTRGLGERSPR